MYFYFCYFKYICIIFLYFSSYKRDISNTGFSKVKDLCAASTAADLARVST